MEQIELLKQRKKRGYDIAQKSKVIFKNGKWLVPSQHNRSTTYEVVLKIDKQECTCLDYSVRGLKCKHIFSVEYTISKQSETEKITITKKVYGQNWKAYNLSQTQEQELFMKLLSELCQEIEQDQYVFGRPKLPLKDMVFSSALKVYSTFSLRRFICDMKTAKEKGYVSNVYSYSSVSNYMRNPELTPLLNSLITLSALPLKSVETAFAIDSSGFRTTKFNDYCREKHRIDKEHNWLKLHICVGTKTNVITACEIGTGNHSSDSPQFIPLAKKTNESGFDIEEMSGDKAYSSRDNYGYVESIGGTAFIPYKSNATGKPRGKSHVWRKMFNYFVYNRDEFMQHYHLRSNVETTFFMIKSKFTDVVRSKNEIAQKNELLLKVLCHNIVVLIQETNELGVEPNFLSG